MTMITQRDEDPPLDEEAVGKSLVPIESRLTMIDVDGAAAAYEAYLELCRRILDETDYATIRGIKARKRSGWAKLRRFYAVSTTILVDHRNPPLDKWEPGQPFVYRFTVEGRMGDRIEQADGTCESEELLCPNCKGEGCQKCKGLGYSIAPTEHNVRAKALTRAKNRVTSDLIGGGEVSAEELNSATPAKKTKKTKKGKAKPKQEANAPTKFWMYVNDYEIPRKDADAAVEAAGGDFVQALARLVKEYGK